MERKVIVVIKENFAKFTICAFESINGDFAIILSHSINKNQEHEKIIKTFKDYIEEIQNITGGNVKNIIYLINDPNYFYTNKYALNLNNKFIDFSKIDLNSIINHLKQDTIDFLACYQVNDIQAIKKDNSILQTKDLKLILSQEIKSLKATVTRYFIKQNAYKNAQNLAKKLSLNIEKMIIGPQLETLYVSNLKNQDQKILINISEDNVLLSSVKNKAIQEKITLNFGTNILISKLANELNITSYEAQCLIANYNHLENDLQLPFLFRKDKTLQVIDKFIKEFYKKISLKITCMLNLSNILDFSNTKLVILESKILSQTTSQQVLSLLNPDNKVELIQDYKLPIYKYKNFNNLVLINYLNLNISDQDITNTYTINTQTIENIKFKKQTIIKNFIKRIFTV
ncbi:hypothetical protein [Mycoplasma zalophi]|uniref:Cell division protein FtsA n=1 Tax=Mycoplasma zalophi TaxID=191287 RepID=A0ABS6DQM7_9MOLU|nr:hypothetical protein [Mycoplasma zalophi]MBU4691357.1 hypothetical protein [Mycoplasma zalophi]MBU4692583.1 hypothetical protein [Mycoplasma zalophi]